MTTSQAALMLATPILAGGFAAYIKFREMRIAAKRIDKLQVELQNAHVDLFEARSAVALAMQVIPHYHPVCRSGQLGKHSALCAGNKVLSRKGNGGDHE